MNRKYPNGKLNGTKKLRLLSKEEAETISRKRKYSQKSQIFKKFARLP